jgi:hypothetical protein
LSGTEQLVYLHIPKTAGTTFGAVLDAVFQPDERLALYGMRLSAFMPGDLAGYRCVRGHVHYGLISTIVMPPVSYITFLRDPIECALSHFGHIQYWRPVPKYAIGKLLDLEEFLYHPDAFHRIANLQSRWLGAPMDLDPRLERRDAFIQARFNEEEEAMAGKFAPAARAMHVLEAMPFFGLVERFDDSIALFSYTFGFAPIHDVVPLNAARRPRPQRAQAAPILLDRLLALNQEDAALYAFAQRLFAARYNRMLDELAAENQRRSGAEPANATGVPVSASAPPTP